MCNLIGSKRVTIHFPGTFQLMTYLHDALEDRLPVEIDLAFIEFEVQASEPILHIPAASHESCIKGKTSFEVGLHY